MCISLFLEISESVAMFFHGFEYFLDGVDDEYKEVDE